MTAFKDRSQRTWTIDLTVAAAKRVRDVLKVSLYDLIDDNMAGLNTLLRDPILLIDVVYVLCQNQADKLGLTSEAFGELFAGEALFGAGEALVEALFDFFPDQASAATLRKMGRKSKEMVALLRADADAEIDSLDPRSLAEKLKKQFGSERASSASTPGHSPSES